MDNGGYFGNLMAMDPQNPILLRAYRGEEVESWHRGAYCVFGGGDVLVEEGDAGAPCYLRSGAKPFQALAFLLAGAAERFGLEDRHLALACASHEGEPDHVRVAREMLAAGGLVPESLDCGSHPPLSGASAAAIQTAGENPSALHNNCSGKHAAMLLAALARSWPTEGYLDLTHPLQAEIREILARLAEVAPSELRAHVDGCSAPTWVLPLRDAARAFRNHGTPPEGQEPAVASACRRLHQAVAREPQMIGGTGRFCSALSRVTAGRLMGKVGAEGFYGVMSTSEPLGLAVWIDDGSWAASERLVAHLLHRLGALSDRELGDLDSWAGLERRNHAGRSIGRFEITLAAV